MSFYLHSFRVVGAFRGGASDGGCGVVPVQAVVLGWMGTVTIATELNAAAQGTQHVQTCFLPSFVSIQIRGQHLPNPVFSNMGNPSLLVGQLIEPQQCPIHRFMSVPMQTCIHDKTCSSHLSLRVRPWYAEHRMERNATSTPGCTYSHCKYPLSSNPFAVTT